MAKRPQVEDRWSKVDMKSFSAQILPIGSERRFGEEVPTQMSSSPLDWESKCALVLLLSSIVWGLSYQRMVRLRMAASGEIRNEAHGCQLSDFDTGEIGVAQHLENLMAVIACPIVGITCPLETPQLEKRWIISNWGRKHIEAMCLLNQISIPKVSHVVDNEEDFRTSFFSECVHRPWPMCASFFVL
ncbi:hypothetical protein TNCV_2949351 [Trichonephila clavipes]|nr:hypothetical protein TNCV_2949351 [Trichonephila clavipes]